LRGLGDSVSGRAGGGVLNGDLPTKALRFCYKFHNDSMTLEFEGIKWQAGVMLPLITLLSKNAKDVNRWHYYENTFKMEQKEQNNTQQRDCNQIPHKYLTKTLKKNFDYLSVSYRVLV